MGCCWTPASLDDHPLVVEVGIRPEDLVCSGVRD